MPELEIKGTQKAYAELVLETHLRATIEANARRMRALKMIVTELGHEWPGEDVDVEIDTSDDNGLVIRWGDQERTKESR